MPCPFGFKAEDEGDDAVEDETEETEQVTTGEGDGASTLKAKKPGATRFDKDADPVSWFYQNQIKSDEQFAAKQTAKQQASKARLERIMASKRKQLEFDADLDALSMASSELSELNSEVHSLRSLKSCAESWIEDAGYKLPAEAWIKFAAPAALVAIAFALFQAYELHALVTRLSGQCHYTLWPLGCLAVAISLVACAGPLHYSTTKRSKRVLLGTQVGLLGVYTAAAVMAAYMHAHPTTLDPKAVEAACQRPGKTKGQDSPQCKVMLAAGRELSESFPWTLAACIVLALSALSLAALGVWYLFELAYIEKKAAKFMKRHRHHRHRIPWHKIKVVGPVMTCGQGGGGHGGAAGKSGGKCPVMH